jgi:hypothetical protein
MRVFIASFIAITSLFSSALPVLAQVGPCGPADACSSGQICRGAAGSRLCYITCTATDTLGSSSECSSSQTCTTPTGLDRTVCTDAGAGSTTSTGSASSESEEPEEAPFDPITPELGVPIPGFTPAAPTREGSIVRVAFLAGYINAVYRYLTGIILVVAIVMVVYGGFLYLVGSAGVGSIQRGKQIITDAIMGMVITLAAFALLNTVSPATTQLKTLELGYVSGEILYEAGGIEEFGEAPAGAPSSSCSAPRRGSSDSTYDSLFQRYAPCAGLDWRILKAVAFKESAFRECVTNRYGFTGLFQVRPDTCALRRFGREADCNRLINPEINTAAAAVGQLRSGADFINRLCPGLSDAHRFVTFLYFAHNSGAGNLQTVIRDVGCNATSDEYDRAATQAWVDISERRGRSLPPNHDSRMRYSRTVADLAISYGVTSPTVARSSCPVH